MTDHNTVVYTTVTNKLSGSEQQSNANSISSDGITIVSDLQTSPRFIDVSVWGLVKGHGYYYRVPNDALYIENQYLNGEIAFAWNDSSNTQNTVSFRSNEAHFGVEIWLDKNNDAALLILSQTGVTLLDGASNPTATWENIIDRTNNYNVFHVSAYFEESAFFYKVLALNDINAGTQTNIRQSGTQTFWRSLVPYANNGAHLYQFYSDPANTVFATPLQIDRNGIRVSNLTFTGDNSTQTTAFRSLNPNPSGTFLNPSSVSVNSYGQVTSIVQGPSPIYLPQCWFYSEGTNSYPTTVNIRMNQDRSLFSINDTITCSISITILYSPSTTGYQQVSTLDTMLDIYPHRIPSPTSTPLNNPVANINNNLNGSNLYTYTDATYAPYGRYYWAHGQTLVGSNQGVYLYCANTNTPEIGIQIINPNGKTSGIQYRIQTSIKIISSCSSTLTFSIVNLPQGQSGSVGFV